MRVDEHTIELASSPVFYRSASAPGPPPLYLHGVPTSSDDWLAPLALTGGVAPDLMGFGRSAKGGHLDYTLEGMATFVERLLEHLGITEVKLVGHDWGAAVALELAARSPARIRSLALVDPVPLIDGFRWPRIARLLRTPGVGELLMGTINRRLLAGWLRRGSTTAQAWPDDRIEQVWRQFDQGTQRAVLRLHRGTAEHHLSGRASALQAIAAPVLVIRGEADPWLPDSLIRRLSSLLPRAELAGVPGAGHWPWLDRPEVGQRLASFLTEAA